MKTKYTPKTQIGSSRTRLVTAADVYKHNAYEFFQDLIQSLTKNKKKWTPKERMLYNRVSKFLEA